MAMVELPNELANALLTRLVPLDTPANAWPTAAVEATSDLLAAVGEWAHELREGLGYVVIQAAAAHLDDEAITSAAWNVFTLFSVVIPQYATGELIYPVEVSRSIDGASHYSSMSASRGHHTDGTLLPQPPDLAMLICLSAAVCGGETVIIDGQGVRAAVQHAGTSMLDVLRQEHPFDPEPTIRGRNQVVFEVANGRIRWRYLRRYIEYGYMNAGCALPPMLRDAMDVIDCYTSEFRHQVAFPLRRGQVLVFDNSRFVHGRPLLTDSVGSREPTACTGKHWSLTIQADDGSTTSAPNRSGL